jgi:hypothetical protein
MVRIPSLPLYLREGAAVLRKNLDAVAKALETASTSSKQAYELSANSYTYSAMNACLTAERVFSLIRAELSEFEDG